MQGFFYYIFKNYALFTKNSFYVNLKSMYKNYLIMGGDSFMTLISGMYVRCSVDWEHGSEPRRFALGQIMGINEAFDEVKVKFHRFKGFNGLNEFFDHVPPEEIFSKDEITRCPIAVGSTVKMKNYRGKIIAKKDHCKDNHFEYYVAVYKKGKPETKIASEKDLVVQFTQEDPSPLEQMKNFELHNPRWYKNRIIVSKLNHLLKNSIFGFESLVGSRVHLMPHQIDTIIKCLSEKQSRFILADEVGLGKTIEALGILKGLKEQVETLKTLLIIPQSLIDQWQNELYYKFNYRFTVWNETDETTDNIIVASEKLSDFKKAGFVSKKWDLCIIDETHQLIRKEKSYKILQKVSLQSKHLLLLSATPIQERKTEYLHLLSLLEPDYYGKMSFDKFEDLLGKQEKIQRTVYSLLNDIDDAEDLDDLEDLSLDVQDIADIINDSQFNHLVREIDENDLEKGLRQIRLCIAYLSQYYQMEGRIVRHRRKMLSDEMPARELEEMPYHMAGADGLYYEENTYNALKDYIRELLNNTNSEGDIRRYLKDLLASMFSSPWALEEVLNRYQSSDFHIPENPNSRQVLIENLRLWRSSTEKEFNRAQELYDDPDLIQGRLLYVLDYLQEMMVDSKVVIFTQFTSTLTAFDKLLGRRFLREEFTTFHKLLDQETLQKNADLFQNNEKCKFILCDELGGEGRNFQIADTVIHIDLPWSANELEQRIGRLDRIGREKDKPVHSVVFYSENSIEKDLFQLWNQGLKIFENSLSGLEIILGEINDQLLQALTKDLDYGLKDALGEILNKTEEMKEYIKMEQHFDIACKLDSDSEHQISYLLDRFNENDGSKLSRIMMSWSSLTGLHGKKLKENPNIIIFEPKEFTENSAKNTLYIPPDWSQYKEYLAKRRSLTISGTFTRDLGIKREDLLFFAPGDPVFDSIVNNALTSSQGRASAFYQKSEFNWEGLVFTWSISPDLEPLLDLGEDLLYMTNFRGSLPLEQINTFHPIKEGNEEFDETELIKEIELPKSNHEIIHLGKRGGPSHFGNNNDPFASNLEYFKSIYPSLQWQQILEDSYQDHLKIVKEQVDKHLSYKQPKKEFEKIILASKASELYFNESTNNSERLESIYGSVLKGLHNPKVKLDSIAYLKLVNPDG